VFSKKIIRLVNSDIFGDIIAVNTDKRWQKTSTANRHAGLVYTDF
jgi:hypothetical protein